MPWALIIPQIFAWITKCLEDKRSQEEIVEAMMNPGKRERRLCKLAVRVSMRDGGYLSGKSFKKRKKILAKGRAKAWDRLENTTRVEAEVWVAGCAARVEAGNSA